MDVRPLGDRVLVSVLKRERVTGGGVVLPDNVREESDRGVVLAVGPGTPYESIRDHQGYELTEPATHYRAVPIEEGQVVLFSPYAGSKVSVGNDDFLLLREGDILGVLAGAVVEEVPEGGFRLADPERSVV